MRGRPLYSSLIYVGGIKAVSRRKNRELNTRSKVKIVLLGEARIMGWNEMKAGGLGFFLIYVLGGKPMVLYYVID